MNRDTIQIAALQGVQVGKCVIINDNCTEVLADLPDNSVDLTFTSPPYGRKRNDKYGHFDDSAPDWFEFNAEVLRQLLRVTRRHVFYNLQANYYNRQDVYRLIGLFSEDILDIHVWEKSNPMPASGRSVTNAVEYFLVLGDRPLRSDRTYTKNIITTSVNSNMPKHHKAVMHPAVARHFLERFSREGDLVLDPFGGLGTTGLVCGALDLDSILIEIAEQYFRDSIENIKQNIQP